MSTTDSTTASSSSGTNLTQNKHAQTVENIPQSEKMFYDDDQDEILVANAENLPRGYKDGFAVVHHFEVTQPSTSQWEALQAQIQPKDMIRLELAPDNLTLPIALMMMDPAKFETVSRARKFCRHGRILLHRGPLGMDQDGKRTIFLPSQCQMGKVGDRVYPGDVIGRQVAVGKGYYSARQQKKAPPFDLPVLYQDDHFAIVDKPAGVVIYSPKHSGQGLLTIKSALPHVLDPPRAGTISALKRPKAIHRLDRPTSGALLIGKTLPAMEHLSAQFRDRIVQKTYTAVVNGNPQQTPQNAISSRQAFDLGVDVDPNADDNWQLIDSPLEDKSAVTIWRVLQQVPSIRARDNCLTMVEIKPKTGRYHQIRRHMAWVCGRPLVGDKEYDGNHESAVRLRGRGLFLCSNKVVLQHPFYNTRAGREVWEALPDSSKEFPGGQLWLDSKTDTVMVAASVQLPTKFCSFLDRSKVVYEKYNNNRL